MAKKHQPGLEEEGPLRFVGLDSNISKGLEYILELSLKQEKAGDHLRL